VVQVIGEMSNKGEPWRKFVQTFFLAEQPGGYYVLNDIFRFLKEDSVDEESGAHEAVPPAEEPSSEVPTVSVPAATQPVAFTEPEPSPAPPAEPEPQPQPEPEPEPEPEFAVPEPPVIEETQVNGRAEVEPEPPIEEEAVPSPIPDEECPLDTVEPVSEASAVIASEPSPQPPTPAAPSPAPAATQAPQLAASPAPSTPAAPKTWANLAATNSKKWGTAVASDSRGTSEVPPPAPPIAQRPPQPAPAGVGRGFVPQPRAPAGDKDQQHPLYQAAMALTTPQCFVKVRLGDRLLRQRR
jgi:hypothetical protein